MNFFNLSMRNMKRNFDKLITYYISMVFTVMVFYVFCSILYNKQFLELSDIELKLRVAFQVSAVVVILFSIMFVWYSNSFFIKSRTKEIATYSLLGMAKKQIARMFFYETLIVGIASLIGGILLGILFSKFFAMLLIYSMKDTMQVTFAIQSKAVISTLIVFLLLYIINAIHGYSIIYRFTLHELFSAQKEGEREPKASFFAGILSIFVIAAGYILALFNGSAKIVLFAIPVLIIVIVGTYMLFNSLIIMLIKVIRKNKKYYYKGTNLISTSQLCYRIKGNVKVLTTIAILGAVTITAVGTAYSMYQNTVNSFVLTNTPYTYMYLNDNAALNKKVDDIIQKHSEVSLKSTDSLQFIKSTGGSSHLSKDTENDGDILLTSVTEFNKIALHQNRNSQINSFNSNNCYVNTDYLTGKNVSFTSGTAKVQLRLAGTIPNEYINSNFSNRGIVVSDKVYNQLKNNGADIINLRGIMLNNAAHSSSLTTELKNIIPLNKNLSAFSDSYTSFFKITGVFVYIGIFLGVIFCLATGSIIYYKQLMEATEDRERYQILRNIGLSKKEIKRSVSQQLAFIFLLPFVVSVIHSTVALIVLHRIMNQNITVDCIYVMVAYGLCYWTYYLVTVKSYTDIVTSGEI